jgi:tetratricopeptide (TPR) repeat protein
VLLTAWNTCIKVNHGGKVSDCCSLRTVSWTLAVLTLHSNRIFLGSVSMTLMSKDGVGFIRTGCLVLLAVIGLLQPALADDTNAATSALDAQDFLRSYLQIQEQLHITQLAVEKNRLEAEAAAVSNSAAVEERLKLMEKTIANDHIEQLGGMERLDRTVLLTACGFAGIGFLVLLLAAFLQWTAVNRLAAVALGASASPSPQGMGLGGSRLPSARSPEQSDARFLGLMEGLERRLQELEASVKPPQTTPGNGSGTGHSNGSAAKSSPVEISPPAAPDKEGRIKLLLGKSQSLLKLDQATAALECLDEAIALDPSNADSLVKKGAALERLQRFQEAIECYDLAIARDDSMIMAYLYKGGVFNRMERHGEALACYEQALKPERTAASQTPSSNSAGD